MEKDAAIAGLQRLKSMLSDEDKKKDVLKKSLAVLAPLALVGGGLLLRKRLKRGPKWEGGERDRYVREIADKIKEHL